MDEQNFGGADGDNESMDSLAERLRAILEPESGGKPLTSSNWVDPREIRADDNYDWKDFGEGESFPAIILDILRQSVLLPRADFQLPIAASYLLLPSTFCNRVPILVSQGGSGTGKSTLSHLACGIHGIDPLGAGSTFPSIRNQIRNSRFHDPESGSRGTENEKNCALAWEDISSRSLREYEGKIFDLLKLGVDRKGKISMAGMNGRNIEFEVFSPKLVSSIHPFYAEHDFRELIRRIIVIEHKRYDLFTSQDHSTVQSDITPDDLLDLSQVDWKGCIGEFNEFWFDRSNAFKFAETRKLVRKAKGDSFPTAYFDMSKDLITTGVVCGFFGSVSEGIDILRDYFGWHRDRIESQSTGTEMVLRTFVKAKEDEYSESWERAKAKGLEDYLDPFKISPNEVKIFLDAKQRDGELDVNITPRERSNVMEALGYRLRTEPGTNSNFWYPASE